MHFLPQSSNEQGDVVLLQPAPPSRAVQDELAFQLLANIAAGSLSSRSNVSLRHAAGITYGVDPYIWSSPELSVLRLEAAFDAAEVVRAVGDLQRLLQQLQDDWVSESELAVAKVALLAEIERVAHNNATLASYLGTAFAEGKAPGWFEQMPAMVAAISAIDVQRVARRYLRPQQLEIGVAGPVSLAPTLESLGELELYHVSRSGTDD